MTFYLHPAIQPYFSTAKSLFDQCMELRGECFRQREGRSTQRLTLGDKTYFIKQHQGVGWKEIIKNIFQLRFPVISAKNEWQAIKKCQALGVCVAEIAAYGERGINPARKQSFILMHALTSVISLEDLIKTWQLTPPSVQMKRHLIQRVAHIARTLHQHGINHRDFYLCHFLWETPISLEQSKLYLIDLHRAQCRRKTPRRWKMKDLAGLYFSSKEAGLTQSDYYRFIQAYQQKPLREMGPREFSFWQQVRKRGEQLYHDHH